MKHPDDKFKYQELKRCLIERITSGQLLCGSRIESEPSLSKTFGLSRNTIRQAVGELEQEGFVYRIQGKGTFVRSKAALKNRRVALLIYDTAYMIHPVTGALISGIDKALRPKGYVLDILAGKRGFYEEDLAQISNRYAGFLIGAYQLDDLTLQELDKVPLPHIFVKNYRPDKMDCAMRIDFERAGFIAAAHLAEQCKRSLALVYSGEKLAISAEFRQGVINAALEYGVKIKNSNVFDCSAMSDGELEKKVEQVINGADAPDAFVCFTDEFAMRIIEVLKRKNIGVPQQIAITGCNDSQLSSVITPSLTSVSMPFVELGEKSAAMLLEMVEGKKCKPFCLAPKLIVRESSTIMQRKD